MEENTPIESEESELSNDPMKIERKKLNRFLILGLLLVSCLIVGVGYYFSSSSTIKEVVSSSIILDDGSEVVEDVPFKEMTIPYLRNREYESTLYDLNEISSSANYTSYLTHYDSDGLNINALLTKPNGQMPDGGFPAIVFVHGYIPPSSYQTNGESYSDYVDYLARNGFVVFKIDLRGHGSSEGDASGAYYSGDYIIDVLNAQNALSKIDFVNPGE